jgi:hypothetical protein
MHPRRPFRPDVFHHDANNTLNIQYVDDTNDNDRVFRSEWEIGARTFHVELCDPEHDAVFVDNADVRAYTDHSTSKIVIKDDGISTDARDELLVHELLHALVKNAGLDQCLKEGFTEEFLVSALAPRIHDFLKRNF